jgi:6-phosphogluconolactonase (cycloisomerase 2 family)
VYRVVALLAVLALGLVAAGDAWAAAPLGTLEQPSAVDGCASGNGTAPAGGSCTNVRGINDPYNVVVSPDGKNLYAADWLGGVGEFSRSASGALVQLPGATACMTDTGTVSDDDPGDEGEGCTNGRAMTTTRQMAISPDGRNVYLATLGVPQVAILSRDPTTGALTQLPGVAGCVSNTGAATGDDGGDNGNGCVVVHNLGGKIYEVLVSPDGLAVYVASTDGVLTVFHRDPNTGALSQDAGETGCVTNDGNAGACRNGRALGAPGGLAITPDGRELIVGSTIEVGPQSAVAYFSIDSTTHALTQLGCLSDDGTASGDDAGDNGDGCENVRAISDSYRVAVSPDGANVYVVDFTKAEVAAFGRDAATGALTQLPGLEGCVSQDGLAVGDDVADNGNACADVRGLGKPFPLLVSADGRSLYTGGFGAGELAVFSRDPVTGALTQSVAKAGCISNSGAATGDAGAIGCEKVRGLLNLTGIALSPDQAHLYTSSFSGGSNGPIARFTRQVAPVCSGFSLATPFQTLVTAALTCSDANGDPLAITADSATGGSLGAVDPASHTVAFTPSPLFSGAGSFAFRASDGSNVSGSATVSVTVGSAPLPPPRPVVAPSLVSRSIRVGTNRRFTLTLKCPATASDCAGKLTVSSKSKLRASKHAKAKVLKIASGSYKIGAGKQGTIRLPLSTTIMGLLVKAGSVKVVVALDPNGPVAAKSQSAGLLPPKKAKAKHLH